jgi:hypothetical protein
MLITPRAELCFSQMIRIALATSVALALALISGAGAQVLPPGPNSAFIDFTLSHASPHAGKPFAGATMTVNPNSLGKIRVFNIRCLAAVNNRLIRTQIEKFYVGRGSTQLLSGATCRMQIPTGSAGMLLTFAGQAKDGFSVGFGKRTASKPTRWISHFGGVWTVSP